MSVSLHQILGPYMEIKSVLVNYLQEYPSCSNKSCKDHKKNLSGSFCPTCGNVVRLQSFPNKKRPTWNDVINNVKDVNIEDDLTLTPSSYGSKEKYILIPNKKFLDRDIRVDGSYNDIGVEINPNIIGEEKAMFIVTFQIAIDSAISIFGKENIKIKWGLVGYWS